MQLSRLELIKDAILRAKSNIQNRIMPRNLNNRSSSYPFLCPDTYLDYCNQAILSESDLNNFIQESSPEKEIDSVYIIGELVEKLILNLESLKKIRIKKLIIMESDTEQNVAKLQTLLSICDDIFSNNLVGIEKRITPLPLGLERRAYRSAGILNHFTKDFSIDPNYREINFLVAWNDATNPKRSEYRNQFNSSKNGLVINARIHPNTIHQLMRKTLFVPSPAGNGLDCHRTWEAMYLGAIPVVLKSEFCGDSSWPVLVVDDWDEIIKMTRKELEELYSENSSTPTEVLDFSHFILNLVSANEK